MDATPKWQFVHEKTGGWWLRLTSDDEIIRYIKATNDRYDGALSKAIHQPLGQMSTDDKVLAYINNDRNHMLLQAATIMAQKYHTTLYSGFEQLQTSLGMALHKDVMENGETFVNPVGGKTFSLDYDQFVYRENLVFPHYSISDIRIKQFPGGNHYYAYVGDMQVRKGDTLKWNTFEQAYDIAKTVIDN